MRRLRSRSGVTASRVERGFCASLNGISVHLPPCCGQTAESASCHDLTSDAEGGKRRSQTACGKLDGGREGNLTADCVSNSRVKFNRKDGKAVNRL